MTKRHTVSVFARNLKNARLAAGLTMAELGDAIGGVDSSTIKSYESARGKPPGSERAVKMARALGVSVEWLLTSEGQGPHDRTQNDLEAHISAAIHRYQSAEGRGTDESLLQELWELIIYGFELLEARHPMIPSRARSLARIAAGSPPPTRHRDEPATLRFPRAEG